MRKVPIKSVSDMGQWEKRIDEGREGGKKGRDRRVGERERGRRQMRKGSEEQKLGDTRKEGEENGFNG